MQLSRLPIAVITPWFGNDLKGGAEQQAWQISTRLALRGHPVEVLTTCCRSFAEDWAVNHWPKGETIESGLTIRRFAVTSRDRLSFDKLNRELLAIERGRFSTEVKSIERERASLWTEGNINSRELEEYLHTHKAKYRDFIFIPYLYGVALNGLPLVANQAWLQPCLHDEAYAYLPDVSTIFYASKGILFNSQGEMQLAAELFGPTVFGKGHVVGEGVELEIDQLRYSVDDLPAEVRGKQFLLCLGRRCKEKGTENIVAAYLEFKYRNPSSGVTLVLAGPGESNYSEMALGVIDVGPVIESQKIALLSQCRALLQPSLNESFSRVIFEAWKCGKTVIVHKDCLATATAVEESGGGWSAGSEDEWVDQLELLNSSSDGELSKIGQCGREFASELTDWDAVITRYERILELTPEVSKIEPSISSKMPVLHQLLPNLSYGDAISNQVLWIRKQLLERGYRSEIFVESIDPRMSDQCQLFRADAVRPDEGLLYHHSIGSEITSGARKHAGPKWFIYHNITPSEFFQPYRSDHAHLLRTGREEMWTLAHEFSHSVGVSGYNAEELQMYGFGAPSVLPLAVDPAAWNLYPDQELMKRLEDGDRNLLYVGRYAPNKCQHHLIEAFFHYLHVDPESRLILVGSADQNDPYVRLLHESINRLNLRERTILAGQVSMSELHAYYRTADLFWSMSEHEGFCVPLVEAMWFDIPILAFSAGAVSETLGGSGITFDQKENFGAIAGLAKKLTMDRALVERTVRGQRNRRIAFSPRSVAEILFQTIA